MKKFWLFIGICVISLSTGVFAEENNNETAPAPAAGQESQNRVVYPRKVEADRNFDGKVDITEIYKDNVLSEREEDTNFDGVIDSWTHYDPSGNPVKTEKDSNKDGKADTWVEY